MNTTEIKKSLYKEKPEAFLTPTLEDGVRYTSRLLDGTDLYFFIPKDELTEYHVEGMEAQLLIRWLEE